MHSHPRGAFVEEGGDAFPAVGDVLNDDYRDALRVGLRDRTFDIFQRCPGIPQRKLAVGKIVVLQVDDDQGALGWL